MSSDARLQRLGLSHLADAPEALDRELARLAQKNDATRAEIQRDLEAFRRGDGKDGGDTSATKVVAEVQDGYDRGVRKRTTGIGAGKRRGG